MTNKILVIILGLCLLAGTGLQANADEGDSHGRLIKFRQSIHGISPCSSIIPMEWPSSFPVPTGEKGGNEFKVFFYPMSDNRSDFWISAPSGEAVFEIETGSVSECLPYTTFLAETIGSSNRRWPEEISGIGINRFLQMEEKLLQSIEEVALIYASAKAPSFFTKMTIRGFYNKFMKMAEPDLLSAYYALNPEFWEWVKTYTGRSILKQ